jgi:hypothetical protein
MTNIVFIMNDIFEWEILIRLHIKNINLLLYEFKILFQLMETLKIVIDIVEKDKSWICCHKTKLNEVKKTMQINHNFLKNYIYIWNMFKIWFLILNLHYSNIWYFS